MLPFPSGGAPPEHMFWGKVWLRAVLLLLHVLQTLPTFIWAPPAGPFGEPFGSKSVPMASMRAF